MSPKLSLKGRHSTSFLEIKVCHIYIGMGYQCGWDFLMFSVGGFVSGSWLTNFTVAIMSAGGNG